MLTFRKMREGGPRYEVIDFGERDQAMIAVIEGLRPAACVLRFLRGSHLQPADYALAVNTMAEIDAREGDRSNAG